MLSGSVSFCGWLLIGFLLAGCGGSSPPSAAPGNAGEAAAPSSWQYTALGDSLAFGVLAQQGYVPRYADYMRQDANATVTVSNFAVPGWRSADLLNALRSDAQMRMAVQSAQVVTFDIGGNDLLAARSAYLNHTCGGTDNLECFRAGVSTFEQNWDAIEAEIKTLRSGSNGFLRTMNVYNPFVAEQKAAGDFTTLKPFLDEVNAHIAASAQANGIPMADVYRAFNGAGGDEDAVAKGLIAADMLHPNDAGHKLIADTLRALGYAPLK